MEEETWSRRGWRGGGILKIVIARGGGGGGTIFICNYYFSENPHPSLGRNKRSVP